MQQLTFGTDKAVAIANVASFTQQNNGLCYAARLWTEILPFNLVWILPNNPGPRPVRSVPSWSWTSADGTISLPLKVHKDEPSSVYTYGYLRSGEKLFRNNWDAVKSLICSESLLEVDSLNCLVYKATLKLAGHLCNIDIDKINISFDYSELPSVEELDFLPVLSFQNVSLPPKTKVIQLHKIILQHIPYTKYRYRRVRYFCIMEESIWVEILTF
jgi:hypothetical protein